MVSSDLNHPDWALVPCTFCNYLNEFFTRITWRWLKLSVISSIEDGLNWCRYLHYENPSSLEGQRKLNLYDLLEGP